MDSSRLIFGCGNFGGIGSAPDLYGQGENETQARELIEAALGCGIRFFDTAHSYGGGSSETFLGRFLPPDVRIATKIGNPAGALPGRRPLEATEVQRQLEISLHRLKRESVHLLYLHEPDRATPLRETFEALDELPRLRDRLSYVQNEFHYLEPGDNAALIPYLRACRIAYCAFSPLAGGLLSGKYRPGMPPPDGSRLALRPRPYLRYLDTHGFGRIEDLAREARRRGETPAQAALRFALAHCDYAVIGPRKREHLAGFFRQPPLNAPPPMPA
ncbi:MAG: aldo/keto reductase [Bdellovibrionota bacterium]